MKKYGSIITVLFICTAILIGCTKEIIRTETCFDGILNNNETGIDCGGSCKSCATSSGPVVAPCTPANNTILFSGTYAASVFTATPNGSFEVTANTSNGDLTITFPATPTTDRIYTTATSSSSLGATQCHMIYTSFYNYYPTAGASVYVNIVGGQVVITYCNVQFNGQNNVNSTAKLTCP